MTGYFLNNRLSAFMLSAALVIAGILSVPNLPVSLMPSADYPALSVIIEYPGNDPENIEMIITRPAERALKTLAGIKEMRSVSGEGKSRINLSFQEGTDIKRAAVQVRERIGLITDRFPREAQEPLVLRFDPSERPVVIAAAEMKGASLNEIRDYLDRRVKPALQRIEGISEVNIAGGQMREIHIEADRGRAEAGYLSSEEIALSVKTGNISVPAGSVKTGGADLSLYVPAGYRSLSEIENTPVFSGENRVSRIRDIASVSYSFREREDISRYEGDEQVTLYIHSAAGANVLSVCGRSIETLSSFSDIGFRIIYNQGEYIGSAVRNAAFSGIWGVLIVFAVLSVFFRKREAVIPIALSIPVSIIIVPLFLYAGGRGINIMSLSGFALAAGMVVDNGIVVMERIGSGGETGVKGVLKAVDSVKPAVIASTATTVSIFAPVIFFSGSAAALYTDTAYTVIWALLVSLFISIVIVPAFYLSISRSGFAGIVSPRNGYPAFIKRHGGYLSGLEKGVVDLYEKILEKLFENRALFLTAAALLFFAALIIFSALGSDAVSDRGRGEFHARLEFPGGSSLEYTDSGVKRVEEIVSSYEEVETVSSKSEKWRGILTIRPARGISASRAERLKERVKREGDIILRPMGGFVYILEADAAASREITIDFTGNDYDTLKKIAARASSLIAGIPGISECLLRFREGRPRYTLVIDRERSAESGVTHAAIADSARSGLFGPVISKFTGDDREIDIRLRYRGRDSIEEIISGSVKTRDGSLMRISELVEAREGSGGTENYRLNGRKSVSITAKTGEMTMREAELSIKRVLDNMALPEEYGYEFDSGVREFRENRRALSIAVLLSVVIIYMVLAALFESLTLPFVLMISIPLALTGVAPVLFIFSVPLSPPVYMGLIVLAGIVVNNGIILINSIHRGLAGGALNGYNLRAYIFDTACLRLRPVLITVCTTVLGMLPLLLSPGEGSALWRPFALTVVTGLLSSTLFTLGVLPLAAYKYYAGKRA